MSSLFLKTWWGRDFLTPLSNCLANLLFLQWKSRVSRNPLQVNTILASPHPFEIEMEINGQCCKSSWHKGNKSVNYMNRESSVPASPPSWDNGWGQKLQGTSYLLLHVHCTPGTISIFSFNLWNNSKKWVPLWSPFFRWANQDIEQLSGSKSQYDL